MFQFFGQTPASNQLVTTEQATGLFTSIISFLTANIGPVLIIVGGMIGAVMVTRMLNGAGKGKGKVKI